MTVIPVIRQSQIDNPLLPAAQCLVPIACCLGALLPPQMIGPRSYKHRAPVKLLERVDVRVSTATAKERRKENVHVESVLRAASPHDAAAQPENEPRRLFAERLMSRSRVARRFWGDHWVAHGSASRRCTTLRQPPTPIPASQSTPMIGPPSPLHRAPVTLFWWQTGAVAAVADGDRHRLYCSWPHRSDTPPRPTGSDTRAG